MQEGVGPPTVALCKELRAVVFDSLEVLFGKTLVVSDDDYFYNREVIQNVIVMVVINGLCRVVVEHSNIM